MLHHELNERKKARGRPFVKGNKNGKPPIEILDDPGRETCDDRQVIRVDQENPVTEDLNDQENENRSDDDEIVFTNGKNKLCIRFFRCNQRRFHIKIFLNDTMEIRPMNFVGGKSGRAMWNLLKDSLKG